jgi:Tol biopolymer transport system component
MLFLAEGDEGEHLYVINKDGSNLADLISMGLFGNSYSWSQDGERIAVQSTYEGRSSLYLVQFAPEPEIIHLAPDQSTRPTTTRAPTWSPNGNRIAYFSAAGITVLDIATQTVQVLTDEYGSVNSPLTWSPDGNWIAFAARSIEGESFECKDKNASGTPYYVYLLASDGSYFNKLTPVEYNFFDWSPDSKKLTFTLCENIYTMSVENQGKPHKLTSINKEYIGQPKWSPDGSMILFTVAQEHIFPDSQTVRTLYTINAHGSNRLTLTDGSTNVHEYGWLDK